MLSSVSSRRLATAISASALVAGALVVTPSVASAATSITFSDPGAATAGPVTLRGTVGVSPSDTTTVLYVIDASRSTRDPFGGDCNGDGVKDQGDDLNGDDLTTPPNNPAPGGAGVGDTLDCEIGGLAALNARLASSAGSVQVGITSFANQARTANFGTAAAPSFFVPASATSGATETRIVSAARTVTENHVGYQTSPSADLGGSGAGTAFDAAVTEALNVLATAPTGPKYVMFLSDGLAPLTNTKLTDITNSGVFWRSFAVGPKGCDATLAPAKMAAAGRDHCYPVLDPAGLAAGLTTASPDSISGVSVNVGGVTVAATVDAIGSWSAVLNLGAGSYTGTVTAHLSSGSSVSAQRTFTIAGAPAGSPTPPPPGTVTVPSGTLKASQVRVGAQLPRRAALPPRVSGTAGIPGKVFTTTPDLTGATVLLQGRATSTGAWTTYAHAAVSSTGTYSLTWHRRSTVHFLQVVLSPYKAYAGSAAAVPTPRLSACKVTKKGTHYRVTCATTLKRGTTARLTKGKTTISRAKVGKGTVTITIPRKKLSGYTLVLDVTKRSHVRLAF